jgi:hypothetical protein
MIAETKTMQPQHDRSVLMGTKKAGPGGPAAEAKAATSGDVATAEQIAEETAFFASIAKGELVESVNNDLLLFKNKRNGLALWRAYVTCREAGEPIPEVILLYFDQMARELGKATTAKQIAEAMHMAGRPGGSARQHLIEADRDLHLLSQVHRLVTLPRPLAINAACKRVAERYGIKWTSLKRAYSRARQRRLTKRDPPARSVFDWRP